MSTNRDFGNMLNEYLPNELLAEDFIKRQWFMENVEKDNKWKGGQIVVPFKGAQSSSVKFGGLTNTGDISKHQFVRGTISSYKEVWGSMEFNHTDIMQHDGRLNVDGFLRILPDQVEDFSEYMKMVASINLLGGPHFAKVTDSTNNATGIMIVDRIDRFEIGQKCTLKDDNSSQVDVYVTGIIVDTNAVTFSLTRGGAAADLSAYTAAQNAKLYHDGILVGGTVTNSFTSLRGALLSSANGGDASLHGVTKTLWPYLQAVNVSGASISATNILDKLFDAYTSIRTKAKGGMMPKAVMSYKHLGSVMKVIESQKGPFKVTATTTKASIYGWTEIDVMGVRGSFTVVGVQEMDDDIIHFMDMSAMTFRSNGFFKKRRSPDGKEYYEVRAESGYKYIVDICLFGELEVTKPTLCGIIYGISY